LLFSNQEKLKFERAEDVFRSLFMKKIEKFKILIVVFYLNVVPVQAEESFWMNVKSDYDEFYSTDRFIRMAYVFAGGAALAHSDADQNFQNDYQNNTRSSDTDDFSSTAKLFGEGKILIPLSLMSVAIDDYLREGQPRSAMGKWGAVTARSYISAAPALLATQRLTGASRPSEPPYQSDWQPFNDSNGVSGHAFIGAVPFISIAYMNEGNTFVQSMAYLASTFTAISRINDDQHYLSQAVLGWYLAWESVDAVNAVQANKEKKIHIRPLAGVESYGVQLVLQWN